MNDTLLLSLYCLCGLCCLHKNQCGINLGCTNPSFCIIAFWPHTSSPVSYYICIIILRASRLKLPSPIMEWSSAVNLPCNIFGTSGKTYQTCCPPLIMLGRPRGWAWRLGNPGLLYQHIYFFPRLLHMEDTPVYYSTSSKTTQGTSTPPAFIGCMKLRVITQKMDWNHAPCMQNKAN